MSAPLTTSLAAIRKAGPCADGWQKLCAHLGKTSAEAKDDTTPLPLKTVLEISGLNHALEVLDACFPERIRRLLAADYAERVLPIFEADYPDDDRPRRAIETARDPNATEAELSAAGAAAGAAEWDAEWDAARSAARDAARDAWAAARSAAGDAEEAIQTARFLQYCDHGDAAAGMPWPEVTP